MAGLNPDFFEKTKIFPVYYTKGKFEGDPKTKKYVRAPFDIVKHEDGTLFVQPCGIGVPDALWGEDGKNERTDLARADFGFIDIAGAIVIGEHEIGDYQGQPENWRGLHRLGFV